MKICLFNVTSTMAPIGSAEVGGVEAYSFRLAEALQQRGHQVTLFGGQPKTETPLPATTVPLRLFPYLETAAAPNLGTRFQRLIQRLHFAWTTRNDPSFQTFDAIFIFKPYDFITAWFWRKRGLRARVVASLHGTEFYLLDRFFARCVDAMYAVASSTAGRLEWRYQQSCAVIPNFIEPQRFAPRTSPEPPPGKIILAVGRLVPIKGMAQLLRAFARVRPQVPEARLVLVGDGPERSRLEKLAAELGVRDAVMLTGVLSESQIIEQHRRCWVYVQPSTGHESFSISTLEAFASGLSVIASDRVEIARDFQKDDAVRICPAADADGLERRLLAALLTPWMEHHQRGQRAGTIVDRKFVPATVLPRIENLLATVARPMGR